MKRVISSFLICITILTLSTPALAADQPHFTDVPADFWAYPYVERAYEDGVMAGTGGNAAKYTGIFSPNNTLTMAQFLTIMCRAFFPEEMAEATEEWEDSGKSGPWYTPAQNVSMSMWLFKGTSGKNAIAKNITRYDMATIMVNVMEQMGVDMPTSSEIDSVQSKIGDYSKIPAKYQTAVKTVFYMGVIMGTDSKGTFSGQNYMNRAQAAVVYGRLADKIGLPGSEVTEPEVTEPEEEVVVAKDVFDFDFSDYNTVNGFAAAVNAATPAYREGYLTNGKPITDENIEEFLAEIQKIIPAGTTWNTNSKYDYYSPKFGIGGGCNSFAYLVSDWMFGEDAPLHKHQEFMEVKPGDVIWTKNQDNSKNHLVVISYVEIDSGDDYYYTESCDGNRNGKVGWNGFGYLDDFIYNNDGYGDLSYIFSRY